MEKAAVARKKKKKKKGPSALDRLMHNRNVRFVLGLVFALLAVFTLVSIVSYLFTWADDQSLLSDDGIYSNAVTAENTGGKAGFLFANLLVSRWFGLGAFVIPFFFAGVSVYCFKKEKVRLLRLFFLSLLPRSRCSETVQEGLTGTMSMNGWCP